MNALVDDLYTFPIGSGDDDGGDTKVYHISAGHTWTLTPTLLMDEILRRRDSDQFVSSPDFTMGNMGLDLGVPGTNDQSAATRGMPGCRSSRPGSPPSATRRRGADLSPRVQPVRQRQRHEGHGEHDLKAGYFLNHLTLDDWQPSVTNPRGIFTFAMNATHTFGTGSQTGNFYNQYAAFLLGLVGNASKGIVQDFTAHEVQHALFVRDRWNPRRASRSTSACAGSTLPDHGARRLGLRDPDLATLEMVLGGLGGNPQTSGSSPKDSFAPRVGGVYRLRPDRRAGGLRADLRRAGHVG